MNPIMKNSRLILSISLAAALAGMCAACSQAKQESRIKPYILDTCAVCDMKLGGVDKPYTFAYKDREIKVCDKSEEAEFKNDPAKYLNKIEKAEAIAKQ
jgi:nitrous oxide reductase accessory protein NosL